MICNCILAGTAACKTCWNNPNNPNRTSQFNSFITGITTVTDTPQITYVPERSCRIVTDGRGWWECDACGCSFDWDSFDRDDPPNCNYCPNCGAKVVKE